MNKLFFAIVMAVAISCASLTDAMQGAPDCRKCKERELDDMWVHYAKSRLAGYGCVALGSSSALFGAAWLYSAYRDPRGEYSPGAFSLVAGGFLAKKAYEKFKDSSQLLREIEIKELALKAEQR